MFEYNDEQDEGMSANSIDMGFMLTTLSSGWEISPYKSSLTDIVAVIKIKAYNRTAVFAA